ncbi:phosphoglucosamine mutase, partial [Escherichia coli]
SKISVSSDKIGTILNYFKEKYKNEEINMEDGLKILLKDGWLHLRPSNTEPIIRIIAETENEVKTKQIVQSTIEEIKLLCTS